MRMICLSLGWLLLSILFGFPLYALQTSVKLALLHIQTAQIAESSKDFSKAFDEYIEADTELQAIHVNSPYSNQLEVEQNIELCENRMIKVLNSIPPVRGIDSNYYVRAWLEMQTAYNYTTNKNKNFKQAIEMMKGAFIFISSIRANYPQWETVLLKAKLKEIDAFLIKIPKQMADEKRAFPYP